MKQNEYFSRLVHFTDIKELQVLLSGLDRLQMTDAIIKKVGAVPLIRFQQMSESQHILLLNEIKDALNVIKAGGNHG